MTAKHLGNLTELLCITSFYKEGYPVSIPYGENSNYDFIADISGRLIRDQVKTASKNQNESYSFSGRHNNKCYAKTSIDFFATYFDNNCYLIPVTECSTEKTLWLHTPKNNQLKNIHFAEEYLLSTQLEKLKIGD